MTLPKKRKRLDENQSRENQKERNSPESKPDSIRKSTSGKTNLDSSRNEQMAKAFEIVEHIEQNHGTEGIQRQGLHGSPESKEHGQSKFQEESVKLRVSVGSLPEDNNVALPLSSETKNTAPVIEVKLKIPSFIWKIPILKGITENILGRLTKDH